LLGRHLILEVYGCPCEYLNDPDEIRKLLLDAARGAGATVIDSMFHRFTPQGVSGVVVIAESHLTIHTWPELGCAALDMFSCSPLIDLEEIGKHLASQLHARRIEARVLERGRIPPAVP
jgi:S-adenosylmethionine decarboxylase